MSQIAHTVLLTMLTITTYKSISICVASLPLQSGIVIGVPFEVIQCLELNELCSIRHVFLKRRASSTELFPEEAGHVLFTQGDKAEVVFFLDPGRAKLTVESKRG